jgi:hypothetical protein
MKYKLAVLLAIGLASASHASTNLSVVLNNGSEGFALDNGQTDAKSTEESNYVPDSIFSKSATFTSSQPDQDAVLTTATSARASFGNLGVATAATATDSTPLGIVSARAEATASFRDELFISGASQPSTTLKIGLQFDKSLNYSGISYNENESILTESSSALLSVLSIAGQSFFICGGDYTNSRTFGYSGGCSYTLKDSGSEFISLSVIVPTNQYISVQLDLSAYSMALIYNKSSSGSNQASPNSSIDSLHSAHNYFGVDDPSLSISTLSGASYSAPVPEPSSLALLFTGLAALALRKKV